MTPIEVLEYINKKGKKPEYINCTLKRWTDVYYGMSLHISGACPKFKDLRYPDRARWITPPYYFGEEYQYLFEVLLFSRHPREHEEQRWWRFSQYRPLTRAPFQQIIDTLSGAIFQDSNYQIEIPEEKDNDFIWSNTFEGHDLMGWFANVCLPNMMEDPNGVIVRIPTYPYYEQRSEKLEVSVWFINSKDILYPYDGEQIIFCKDRYVYHIDKLTIWRYSWDDKKKEYFISPDDIDGYYAHMFDHLPFDVAGGIWNTQGFYDSYLMKAKPIADDYVSSYSGEQMVDKEASHPFITIADDTCPECNGIKQVQQDCDTCPTGWELVNCSNCQGRGTISRNPGDRIVAPVDQMENDLVKITNPDTGINKYHHDKNKDIYLSLLDSLNLLRTEQAQSGTAKAIDQERLYQFISKVSNNLFDKIIYGTLRDIIAYRNLGIINGVPTPTNYSFSIQKPTQFQIKTANDLLDEFKMGKDAGMPAFLRQKMVLDYLDKQYSGDPLMKKKGQLILELDKTAIYTVDEKLTKQTLGDFDREELVYSDNLPGVLDRIIREKGEKYFLSAEFDKIEKDISILMPIVQTDTDKFDDFSDPNTQ